MKNTFLRGVACAIVAYQALSIASLHACTAVIVGRKASATGHVIVGHNEDGSGDYQIRHALVPARDGRFAFYWSEVKLDKGNPIPGDMMLNENGVIVFSNNGGWQKTWCGRTGTLPDEGEYSTLADGGIGFDLRRTIAERAKSAREGVDIATNLITTCGYRHPSRIFTIADRDEAWVVEAIKGRRFVARRCPDDAVVVHPNCLSIREIRPDDIVSANIAAKGPDFDFTAAYQGPRDWRSPYNRLRWRHLYRLTCGIELTDDDYPFAVKPRSPVTPEMIKAGLSSHYEDTADEASPRHPAKAEETSESRPATICRASTQESIVCAFADAATNALLYCATGRPCETPYGLYRPLGGILPTDALRGEPAVRRLADRALPRPRKSNVAVFTGRGPKSNGAVEYMRLIAASPEMELTLVDAEMIRAGALEGQDLLVMPGGDSRSEKRDLGPEGARRIKEFLRRGGNYVGSCAGCCLLMDSVMDAPRGIGIIPYHRTGSKGGYMMQVKVNAAGAKALGIEAKTYTVRYHGGPVLEPSTNSIADADFAIWGTYDADFGKPGSKPEMLGRGAMVGGTYGKGRVFAFTVHPENFPGTRELLRGAFRYALGHDVTFPERMRKPGALSVGWFSQAISGVEPSRVMLEVDKEAAFDLFPIAADEILRGMLDHVDVLVLPQGDAKFYEKALKGVRELIAAFGARGGKVIGWGEGAKAGPEDMKVCACGEDVLAELERLAGKTKDIRIQ